MGENGGEDLEAGGGAQMGVEEGVCEQSRTQGEEGKGAREEQERTRWKEKGQTQREPWS